MTEPMPEAVEAAARADFNRTPGEKWEDLLPDEQEALRERIVVEIAAAEKVIRADERAKPLAPIKALCAWWSEQSESKTDPVLANLLSELAAIAQAEDPS